jgi:multidrug efflux pump subunit AcrB
MAMDGIVSWWGRNAVAGNLLMIACLVVGIVSFVRMEKEFFPPGDDDAIMITASWPGASPQDVESQVTVRIEEAIAAINGVDWTRSQSGEGYGWVRLTLSPGTDATALETEVRSKVEAISGLPPAVERIQVQRFTGRDFFFLLSLHGDADERTLRDIARRMRDEIALLEGGVNTEVWGTRTPEVSIELSEEAMRRYGLTFDEVANAVRQTSINAGGGSVRTEEGSFQLQVRNLADTETDFAQIVVRQTADGGVLTVGDVATIVDGFQDVDSYSVMNGQSSVMLAVLTPDQADITAAGKAMDEWLEQTRPNLPDGLKLTTVIDSRDQYNSLLGILFSNAAMGFFLIFVLLLLTLHPTVAFWSTLGVITAFAGSFIILPYVNVSMNFMTVFGFLLVLGIMVDDAIIVGEAIYERVERGETGVEASILATQLVMKPLLASVMTTMIAFSPLMFIEGGARQFTQAISIVIMSTLFFSLVETLIILPAHLGHVKVINPSNTFVGRLMSFQQIFAKGLLWFAAHVHGPLVRLAIRLRWLTVSIFIVVFMLAMSLFNSGHVKTSFMPEVEGDFLYVSVQMPRTATYTRMQEVAAQVDRARLALNAETTEMAYTDPRGETSEGIILTWAQFINGTTVENYVTLTPPQSRDLRTSLAGERLKDLIGDIPDAERINVSLGGGGGGGGRIEIAMIGEDAAELRAAVDELKAHLASFEAVTSVRDSQEAANEELRFALLPGAEQLGVSLADVQRQVRQAYFGEEVQRLPRDGDEVRVYVRYPRDDRRTLDSLEGFRIRTADGREVPLSTVAVVSYAPGVSELDRRQRQPTITVEAEAAAEDRAEITRQLDEEFYPQLDARYPGVSRRMIGEQEAQQEFVMSLATLGGIALFGIFFVLAITFRSYIQPALIMSVIPFAFVGAVVSHFVTGTSFALFSWLGMVAAIGVVVNDNVVLMDRVNRLREEGADAYSALNEGSISRFRQIFLTSITEFVGLLPMLAETEVVAQFLKPMALSLALGVLLTMPASLYLTPSLYMCGVDIKNGFSKMWRSVVRAWQGPRAKPAE